MNIKKKKSYISLVLCAAVALTALTAVGCEDKSDDSQVTSAVATADTASQSTEENQDLDVGEHKDYDKETASSYDSGNIIIVSQDGTKRGMELYTMQGGASGCLEFYANELNTVKETVGKKVNVYSIIAPSACELYAPADKRELIDSQEQILKDFGSMLMDVKQVDVLSTLKNHNAEEIYYRTDSRWTPLGAYYAGKAFAKAAGVPYADISEYTPTKPKDYVGDLTALCGPEGAEDLEKHPDKFSYYAPKCSFVTNYYDEEFKSLSTEEFYTEAEDNLYQGYYKGGFYCLRLDTDVKNGRKVIVVKDEYGTNFPTFLTSSFSEIYVVSYDYLSANLMEMIDEFGITDVLYLMNIYTATDSRVYDFETLRTQASHGNLEDNVPHADVNTASTFRSSTDTTTDDPESSGPEYVYGVGLDNIVSVIEHSDIDTEAVDTEENIEDGYSSEEIYNEDYYNNESGYEEDNGEEEDYWE